MPLVDTILNLPTADEFQRRMTKESRLLRLSMDAVGKVIEENRFITFRNLDVYGTYLGPRFQAVLQTLGSQAHWIDVGAGDAYAMFDLYKSFAADNKPLCSLPLMTAVTVAQNAETWESDERKTFLKFNKFQYLVGKYIENYKNKDLTQGDLVTDLLGSVTYMAHVDRVLRKIGLLLKPGGTAILTTVKKNLILTDGTGNTVTVVDWLKKAKGIELEKSEEFLDSYSGRKKRIFDLF
jgi:SAM-dependent methyltransferase